MLPVVEVVISPALSSLPLIKSDTISFAALFSSPSSAMRSEPPSRSQPVSLTFWARFSSSMERSVSAISLSRASNCAASSSETARFSSFALPRIAFICAVSCPLFSISDFKFMLFSSLFWSFGYKKAALQCCCAADCKTVFFDLIFRT